MDRHTLSFSASRDVRNGPFEGAEIERMGLVGPHVIRAFRLTALAGEMRREAEEEAPLPARLEHQPQVAVLEVAHAPCTRRDERLEVPAPKSPRSTSATRSPRSAASRAMPAPLMPPPMTSRS